MGPPFFLFFQNVLKRLRYFIAACPEKRGFHSWGGGSGGLGSLVSEFSGSAPVMS